MESDEGTSSVNEVPQQDQEPLLNISASQLVQIMTCAMKRKSDDSPKLAIQNKKPCMSSTPKLPTEEQESDTRSRKFLVERNRYLERRVKQLEALNYNLQCGLLNSVRETITESLEAQLRMNDLVLRRKSSSSQGNQQQPISPCTEQRRLTSQFVPESLVNDVTSTTSRTPDLSSEVLSEESHSPLTSRSSAFAPPSMVKTENLFDESGPLQILQNTVTQFESSISAESTYPSSSSNTITENNYQIQPLLSNSSNSHLLGMAHEIQTIVRESTNYKKLTNRLLSVLFDREELANSTLTGKSKGDQEKDKLDEDTVNLIVQQAIMRFPGTSPTDIRVVISQNCKDKALRLQRKVQREALQQQLQPNPPIHREALQPQLTHHSMYREAIQQQLSAESIQHEALQQQLMLQLPPDDSSR